MLESATVVFFQKTDLAKKLREIPQLCKFLNTNSHRPEMHYVISDCFNTDEGF